MGCYLCQIGTTICKTCTNYHEVTSKSLNYIDSTVIENFINNKIFNEKAVDLIVSCGHLASYFNAVTGIIGCDKCSVRQYYNFIVGRLYRTQSKVFSDKSAIYKCLSKNEIDVDKWWELIKNEL